LILFAAWNGENCNRPQLTASDCTSKHRTATHCSTLQRTAMHCNALQHTATHCNVSGLGLGLPRATARVKVPLSVTVNHTLQHILQHIHTLQHILQHISLNHTLQHILQHISSPPVRHDFDRKKPSPPGGFPIYYIPSSRDVCKRTSLEGFVPGSSRGVLSRFLMRERSK